MKVLIIGGTGILSSAVVDECVKKGYEVTMLNRGRNTNFINPLATLIKCDVYKEDEVRQCLKGKFFDTIVDFLVRTKTEIEYSLKLFGNIAKQYVFISSAQVYDNSVKEVLKEDHILSQPLWAYSVNKAICERYVEEECSRLKINYTIIRPGVNFGNTRIPYGMYPSIGSHWTLVSRIKSGKPIITWNEAQDRLNITRVEDFACGTVGLLGNDKAYNEAFNVVGDNVYTWNDVLNVLGKLVGCEVNTINLPLEFYANELDGDTRESLIGGRALDLVCSNEKLKKVYPSYVTKYDLEEGMKLTLEFYEEHNFYQGFDYDWDGSCDRIINKYYQLYGSDKDKKNIGFINYENYGNRKINRSVYLNAYYKYDIIKKLLNKIHI